MKCILWVFIVTLMACTHRPSRDGVDTHRVQLESGMVQGIEIDGIRQFLGIPYAAPPVGDRRWKAPQSVLPWSGVRQATEFGKSCSQTGQSDLTRYAEDCLFLNVWAPSQGTSLPVMVWIHGGGFTVGSSALSEYDGKNLSRKGVVVVSLNYRLGPFGFLVHPRLSKESSHHVSGNYGFLDQIAALQWVQRHIARFGGDPTRVTIFGQSAGSRSVSLHLTSPLSKGLFHRAIASSGDPLLGSKVLSPSFDGDAHRAALNGESLARALHVENETDVLKAMRTKTDQEILRAADCHPGLFDDDRLFFAPVFDGWVFPHDSKMVFSEGLSHDVPVIVGSVKNEGNHYLVAVPNLGVTTYHAFLKKRFGARSTRVAALFPASTADSVKVALDRIVTIGVVARPARTVARSMEKRNSKAYLYQFTRLPNTKAARQLGVFHGIDIAYIFGHTPQEEGYTDVDRALSNSIMNYWVNFAKTGNPNGPNVPEWPAYQHERDVNLEFSDSIHTNQHLFKKECDFFEL